MFDITSSKLLILGIVALLVIGPKDLPALLRTIGKYMGIIKRHAADFRAQFDEAMRESELEQLKKDVEKMGTEAEATMRAAELSVDKELADARQDVDALMGADAKPADRSAGARRQRPADDERGRRRRDAARPQRRRQAGRALPPASRETETAAVEPGSAGVKTGA